jgi:hypothetical protein
MNLRNKIIYTHTLALAALLLLGIDVQAQLMTNPPGRKIQPLPC